MVSGSREDDPGVTAIESLQTSDKRQVLVLENRIDSKQLFSTTREVMIAHGEAIYRLRLTSQNKLILTK